MTTEQPISDTPESQDATNGGEARFTQADVDRLIKDRLDRERRKSHEATEKARQEAEAKGLQEQGKFKELADQLAAKVTELTPYQERITAYDAALKPHIDDRIKALPEALRDLVDSDADALTMLDTLAKLETAARKLQPAETPPAQPLRSTARGPVNNQAPAAGAALASDILLEKRARMGSL